ncbi:bacterial regulatory s, luxR family protein [Escherichia coli 3-373-03_S3_C2]|nr:bacterial regulatory s, luxR family protein [Escherichia coli 3-373-03_S3_C2]
MRRTFTAEEKASVFELWKNGTGFSEIANILGSKPGTIFTMLRDTGGIKPHEHKRAVAHLTLSEREEIRAGLSAKMSIRAIATALNRSPSTISREVQRNRGRRITKLLMLITEPTEWRKGQNRAYWIKIYHCESLFWKSWR